MTEGSVFRLLYDTIAKDGAKYEPDAWQIIEPDEHWRHAKDHLEQWRYGNGDPAELAHAVWRILFIMELEASR